MPFTRYLRPLALSAVLSALGGVLKLVGCALAVPLLPAAVAGEWRLAAAFGGIGAATAGLGWLVARGEGPSLERREAFVVTALAYLVYSVAGACVFWLEVPWVDGFFESMSGITTTGLSVTEPTQLPGSLVFFRAWSQWIGGVGIAVLSVVVLAGPEHGTLSLYSSESTRENLLGDIVATARRLAGIYVGITLLIALGLVATGLELWPSLLLAFTTISTGGFSAGDSLIPGGFWIPCIIGIGMILGATALPLFYEASRRRIRPLMRDVQWRMLFVVIGIATVLRIGWRPWELDDVLRDLFHAVSALTTSGFSLTSEADWSETGRLVTGILMLVGGATGSTAGGIKLLRLLVLVQLVRVWISRAILPREATVTAKIRGQAVSERDIGDVAAFVAIYAALLVGSAVLLSLGGYGVADAIFESGSALGTVGLSVGITSPEAPAWVKLLLVFEMWAGRLEVVPLVVLLHPSNLWPKRRKSS